MTVPEPGPADQSVSQELTLLETKLRVPRPGEAIIERRALTSQLDQVTSYSLTLISAPAGSGKTTLASSWVRRRAPRNDLPTVWYSLDEDDNDPLRFLNHLIGALRQLPLHINRSLARALASGNRPPLRQMLARLINDVAGAPTTLVLILDDYHLIREAAIHDGLAYLLAHQPSNLHLVLITREDPPLPLARLRVQSGASGLGKMQELRARDLRFDRHETAHFLEGALAVALSAQEVDLLYERTEGWIAGLQLAALALRPLAHDPAARRDFIHNFAGDDRLVIDFLMEEVLARQPDEVRDFLIRTSLLDRFNASLCAAVMGRRTSAVESQEMLEHLESANLFLIPLDNRRHWYRYHHMFADLLRYQLARQLPQARPVLERRAAAWYAENGLPNDAVRHFLDAGAAESAAELVARCWPDLLIQGHIARLAQWLARLPQSAIAATPRLLIADGWVQAVYYDAFDHAEERLQQAEALLDDTAWGEKETITGHCHALRAYIGRLQGAPARRLITLSRQALAHLPPGDFADLLVATNLPVAHLVEGDGPAALDAIESFGARLHRPPGPGSSPNHFLLVSTESIRTAILARQGHLRQAERRCRRVLANCQDITGGSQHVFESELLEVNLATILYEWNRLDEARRLLRRALAHFGPGNQIVEMTAAMLLARVCRAADANAQDEEEALEIANRLAETTPHSLSLARYRAAFEAAMALQNDVLDDVYASHAAWQTTWNVTLDAGKGPLPAVLLRGELPYLEQTTLVRLRIARHVQDLNETLADVHAYLNRRLREAQAGGWMTRVVELLALAALAHEAAGNRPAAMIALQRALELGQPEGYVRRFVDEGPAMARLLYAALEQDLMPDYTGRLLSAFDLERAAPHSPGHDQAGALVEPLSEREQQVLHLIAAGLSNREIASELVVSIHTVKSHASNLYGKLGVSSRTEAIAVAQSLGLLGSPQGQT